MTLIVLTIGVVIGMALAFTRMAKWVERAHDAETRLAAAPRLIEGMVVGSGPAKFTEEEEHAYGLGAKVAQAAAVRRLARLACGDKETTAP